MFLLKILWKDKNIKSQPKKTGCETKNLAQQSWLNQKQFLKTK